MDLIIWKNELSWAIFMWFRMCFPSGMLNFLEIWIFFIVFELYFNFIYLPLLRFLLGYECGYYGKVEDGNFGKGFDRN